MAFRRCSKRRFDSPRPFDSHRAGWSTLSVDHCHATATGLIRGLLCAQCGAWDRHPGIPHPGTGRNAANSPDGGWTAPPHIEREPHRKRPPERRRPHGVVPKGRPLDRAFRLGSPDWIGRLELPARVPRVGDLGTHDDPTEMCLRRGNRAESEQPTCHHALRPYFVRD